MKQINCDMGECLQSDPDVVIMPLIDMANIACGGHAGDEASITKTLQLAKQHNVSVGAHPSYQDKANFGRVSHDLAADVLRDLLLEQLTQFQSLCQQYDCEMSYIKPHGALYHDMMHKPQVLNVICDVLNEIDTNLLLVVQAGLNTEMMLLTSEQTGVKFIFEAFADRAYRGRQMVPRSEAGAMLMTAESIVKQYHALSTTTEFQIDTICFHSDHAPSVSALEQLRK